MRPKADQNPGTCSAAVRACALSPIIGTAPRHADAVVRECDELGITRVWMHQGIQAGSVSETAADYCRQRGISVIAGSCPLMYGSTADFSHRCIRWYLERTGAIPTDNWEASSSRNRVRQ